VLQRHTALTVSTTVLYSLHYCVHYRLCSLRYCTHWSVKCLFCSGSSTSRAAAEAGSPLAVRPRLVQLIQEHHRIVHASSLNVTAHRRKTVTQ